MSIREKITSILFGSKEEPPVQEEGGGSLQPEPQEEAAPESSPFPAEEPALIKLTAEHPLQQLYTIRRRERGGLPAPRLCLDEEGVLPPEVVKKEKSRLQGAVRTAAAFRLKSVQNQNKNAEKARQKKAAKGEDGEDPEKKPAGMDAHPWIFLSADKLFAWVMVFPPTGQGRELTREDYDRLIATARQLGRERLALLMETICATGIRVSEVKYLTVEAVEAGRAEISLKGKIRTILIPGKLCRKLRKYARTQKIVSGEIFLTRNGKGLSRRQIWAEMKSLCAKAGVEATKVFPHNLRHLFAQAFYRVCRDVVKLADVLGHSSIETTRIYLISTGEEHVRQLDRLGLIS